MTELPYRVERFRKALVQFICGRAVQAVGRALLLLVLVRVLAVSDYGAYMLVIGLAETLLQVASLGILPVGQRYLPEMLTTLPARRLFRFVAVLMAAQLAVLLVFTLLIWKFWPGIGPVMGFSSEQIVATQTAVSLFLLIPAFRFSAELLDALLEQGRAQIARALMPIVRLLGIGFLLVASEVNLANVLFVDVVVTLLCLLLSWVFLVSSLKNLHTPGVDGVIPLPEMFRFARHMAVTGLMGAAGSPGALRFAIANALGLAESGLFAFLQSLQRLVGRYLPGTLLRGLVRPVLVARAGDAGGIDKLRAGIGVLFKCNLLIVAGGVILIAVAGDQIVDLLSGGKFDGAGFTLLLMFIALAVTSQRALIEMLMQITGHTSILGLTSIVSPVALLAVWYFASLGLNAAIIIIAISAALSNWLAMYLLTKSVGSFRTDWRGLLAIMGPAAGGLITGAVLTGVLTPLAAGVVALSVFSLLLLVSKPLASAEATMVERAVGLRAARVLRRFTN